MDISTLTEKVKNRGFWSGLFTAVGAFIGGSLTAPEFIINLIKLIGG